MSLLVNLPQELVWIIFSFAFVYGAIFGSFSSVLVSRIHSKKQWIFLGRSACPDCGHTLHFWDLFPIFSYAYLRGKCRYCHKKIPTTYFFLEIFGWVLGAIFAYALLNWSENIYEFIFGSIIAIWAIITMLTYTLYDYLYLEIPDEVLIPAILFLVGALVVSMPILHIDWIYHIPMSFPYSSPIANGVLGALVIFSFFMVQILISGGKWMWWWDLRIALFLGLLLGFKSTLIALFFAYISGSIIGIILILTTKKSTQSQIPFWPFLTIGIMFALILSPIIAPMFLPSSL